MTQAQRHDSLLMQASNYDECGDSVRAHDCRTEAYDIAVELGWEGPDGPIANSQPAHTESK